MGNKVKYRVLRRAINFAKRVLNKIEEFNLVRSELIYENKELPSILESKNVNFNESIFHVSAFSYGNAGDILLPIALRDTWGQVKADTNWISQAVYPVVDDLLVEKINESKGLVIGGGGLFLKDTNANSISGWQWPCSIDMLNQIKVPIVMFAVGYNRFRNQDDFEPCFTENIKAFANKCEYIGLRNYGSLESIKKYIPENLHAKLRYQPCMTTFLSKLYPDLCSYTEKEDFIAVNAAFDRSHLRFGENIGTVLNDFAKAVKYASKFYPIKFYSHMDSDDAFLPFLQSYGVKYELIKLNNVHPSEIIKAYAKPRLVIGMRGHAQMIPFGCNTPIVSIVSHDKMQWFLDDIGQSNWGADVLSPTFKNDLIQRIDQAINDFKNEMQYITEKQNYLYKLSIENVKIGFNSMHLS